MRAAGAICLLAAAACSQPVEQSEWERQHQTKLAPPEEPVHLPAYPPRGELLEFSPGPTSALRFYIDASSIRVADGIVRYVLVARSEQGAQNVSYEGMRCATGEVRIYAVGRDGGWSAGKPGEWRGPLAWHRPLYREYFCPLKQSIRSPDEGVEALRR